MKIRLDKYLADTGLGTRTEVKALVKNGAVSLNDMPVKDSSLKIDTETDIIQVHGKRIGYSEYEYYMLSKPAGIITASRDKKAKTVLDLIEDKKRRDLFPVGRLDKDTEGLLLITNDGDMAHKLLSPKKHVSKTYIAFVSGEIPDNIYQLFKDGLDIGDDKKTKPAELKLYPSISELCNVYPDNMIEEKYNLIANDTSDSLNIFEITITEGRYHEIKRMFEAVGCAVVYLKRYSMGSILLDFSLQPGEYRILTDEELSKLKSIYT